MSKTRPAGVSDSSTIRLMFIECMSGPFSPPWRCPRPLHDGRAEPAHGSGGVLRDALTGPGHNPRLNYAVASPCSALTRKPATVSSPVCAEADSTTRSAASTATAVTPPKDGLYRARWICPLNIFTGSCLAERGFPQVG